MYAVVLSGSVIVLAYVAAAAVIIPAISMIGFGRVPKFLRRGANVLTQIGFVEAKYHERLQRKQR